MNAPVKIEELDDGNENHMSIRILSSKKRTYQ